MLDLKEDNLGNKYQLIQLFNKFKRLFNIFKQDCILTTSTSSVHVQHLPKAKDRMSGSSFPFPFGIHLLF